MNWISLGLVTSFALGLAVARRRYARLNRSAPWLLVSMGAIMGIVFLNITGMAAAFQSMASSLWVAVLLAATAAPPSEARSRFQWITPHILQAGLYLIGAALTQSAALDHTHLQAGSAPGVLAGAERLYILAALLASVAMFRRYWALEVGIAQPLTSQPGAVSAVGSVLSVLVFGVWMGQLQGSKIEIALSQLPPISLPTTAGRLVPAESFVHLQRGLYPDMLLSQTLLVLEGNTPASDLLTLHAEDGSNLNFGVLVHGHLAQRWTRVYHRGNMHPLPALIQSLEGQIWLKPHPEDHSCASPGGWCERLSSMAFGNVNVAAGWLRQSSLPIPGIMVVPAASWTLQDLVTLCEAAPKTTPCLLDDGH